MKAPKKLVRLFHPYRTLNKSPVNQIFPSNIVLSHKPNQIIRSWPPQAIQLKITTGFLQRVTSLRSFLYLINFANCSEQPDFCNEFPHVDFFLFPVHS